MNVELINEVVMEIAKLILDRVPAGPSVVAAALTLGITTAPFLVPVTWLPLIQLPSEGQLGLLRTVVALVLLLIGSFVTFLCVIHYYRYGKGAETTADRILKVRAAANRQALVQDAYFRRLGK